MASLLGQAGDPWTYLVTPPPAVAGFPVNVEYADPTGWTFDVLIWKVPVYSYGNIRVSVR